MARIVAGMGVPHTPAFPANVPVGDPANETSRFFQRVADQLEAVSPDVILMFDSDHLNTFFLDNMPMISVGVAAGTSGPNDFTPGLPAATLAVPEEFAAHVRDSCIDAQFDVALTREFTVDHSILVPLHFLTPAGNVPLLPVFINGLVPPLPAAQRCWDFGRAVGRAVADWPAHVRVAVLASGSFSLDVGGPSLRQDLIFGVPAEDWVQEVYDDLDAGNVDAVVAKATPKRLAAAGNVGGELLNWIAMLAATAGQRPTSLDMQVHLGHGYGFWDMSR